MGLEANRAKILAQLTTTVTSLSVILSNAVAFKQVYNEYIVAFICPRKDPEYSWWNEPALGFDVPWAKDLSGFENQILPVIDSAFLWLSLGQPQWETSKTITEILDYHRKQLELVTKLFREVYSVYDTFGRGDLFESTLWLLPSSRVYRESVMFKHHIVIQQQEWDRLCLVLDLLAKAKVSFAELTPYGKSSVHVLPEFITRSQLLDVPAQLVVCNAAIEYFNSHVHWLTDNRSRAVLFDSVTFLQSRLQGLRVAALTSVPVVLRFTNTDNKLDE